MSRNRAFSLFVVMAVVLPALNGTPPSIPMAFQATKCRISPKPRIDEWSTLELTVKSNFDLKRTVPFRVNTSGIEVDLPLPDTGYGNERHIGGIDGQLPRWEGISQGDVRTYSFRVRPYWYGHLEISIPNMGFHYWIGMGADGKCTFAGTPADLEAIVGKRETPGESHPDLPVYSREQLDKQDKLLSKRKQGLFLDTNSVFYVISGRGRWQERILREDYYIPRDLGKNSNAEIKVRILSRLDDSETPILMPTKVWDKASVSYSSDNFSFSRQKDGFRTSNIKISTGNDDVQTVLFYFRAEGDTASVPDEYSRHGFNLRFGKDGRVESIWR